LFSTSGRSPNPTLSAIYESNQSNKQRDRAAIWAWRAEQGAVSARSAHVPLTFARGEAFQFDWSEEGLVIGGVWRKVQLAHRKLRASRAFWLVAYSSQGHEMLFDAHTRCLTGMQVDPAQAAGTSEYQGQTYYFCSKGCKTKFDASPGQYVK
jgi:YHS domain-containing protein